MAKAFPAAPVAAPGTLAAALAAVPDPRRPRGWNPEHPPVPLVVLLQVSVAAIASGARSLYAIAQWGREMRRHEPAVLLELGLAAGQIPCVREPAGWLHRVFTALDVAAFERAVGEWLTQTGVDPTEVLALDGKTLRGIHGEAIPGVQLVAADAQRLLALARGHWGIENALHSIRDVTFDEDRCQVRSGAAPEAFAICRNLALALLRRRGCPQHRRRSNRAVHLVCSAPPHR